MGSLSDFAEDALVNHLLNTAYTPVAQVFVALCTADPTDAGTGASMNETANAAGYARTSVSFLPAVSRRVVQAADVSFPQATANYAAPITHWSLVDTGTYGAGNMLAHGGFVSSFQPITGNTPVIPTALQEIEVEFTAVTDRGLSDYAVHNLLNLMFRNNAFPSPAGSTYVSLSNTLLNDQDVANTDYTEVTGTGYARQLVDQNGGTSPTWSTVSGGSANNAADVDFGTVGAGGWTQIVSAVLIDSASGAGNVLGYNNDEVVDQTPQENDTVTFPTSNLTVSMT